MNDHDLKIEKSKLYAGIVWVTSAFFLVIYGVMIFFNSNLPGMGDLVKLLSSINKEYIYFAAAVSIFIEGLYFLGSFFPGTSLVMIISIISGTNGYIVLFTTLISIFITWNIAGIINIYLAKIYRNRIIKMQHSEDYHIKDHVWTTWLPAFRSSYEVAQVIEGGRPFKVFLSSLRVRFWATILVGCATIIIPIVFDIHNLSDTEGFLTIFIVCLISLVVGIRKIRGYFLSKIKE